MSMQVTRVWRHTDGREVTTIQTVACPKQLRRMILAMPEGSLQSLTLTVTLESSQDTGLLATELSRIAGCLPDKQPRYLMAGPISSTRPATDNELKFMANYEGKMVDACRALTLSVAPEAITIAEWHDLVQKAVKDHKGVVFAADSKPEYLPLGKFLREYTAAATLEKVGTLDNAGNIVLDKAPIPLGTFDHQGNFTATIGDDSDALRLERLKDLTGGKDGRIDSSGKFIPDAHLGEAHVPATSDDGDCDAPSIVVPKQA